VRRYSADYVAHYERERYSADYVAYYERERYSADYVAYYEQERYSAALRTDSVRAHYERNRKEARHA